MTRDGPQNLRHVCFAGKPHAACRQAAVRPGSVPPLHRSGASNLSRDTASKPAAAQLDQRDCLARWIIARAGLDAGCYRHQPLQRRLPACLRMLKAPSATAARRLLDRRPELLPPAVSSLLIGVTEFFRDADVFACIRSEVLPRLQWRRGPLRICSAACASGDELYSMAILSAEAGLLGRSFLLGTDCRADALEQARSATYPANSLRALDPALRDKYFEAVRNLPSPACGRRAHSRELTAPGELAVPGTNGLPSRALWRPIRPLRRQTRWQPSDVTCNTEPGPWDVILWRNLAIYLNPAPVAAIWNRLADALAPGGYLIVGRAERPPAGLGLAPVCRCIYRKTAV